MRVRSLCRWAEPLVSAAAFLALALFPGRASAAALAGVKLCLTTVIPSLFPFFVLSGLLLSSLGPGGGSGRGLLTGLFGVRPQAAALFPLGLAAGYPVGAASVAALVKQGGCTREEGERLLLSCSNCGPGFLLGAVGGALGSPRIAALLLLCQGLVSFWLAALLGAGRPVPPLSTAAQAVKPNQPPFPARFAAAMRGAGRSMLTVCAYVVFFSVLQAFLPSGPLLRGLLELTSGVCSLGALSPISAALAAFLTGFGGLAVVCQVYAVLEDSGLRGTWYLPCRLLHGLVSALAVWLCLTAPGWLPLLAAICATSVVYVNWSRKRALTVV